MYFNISHVLVKNQTNGGFIPARRLCFNATKTLLHYKENLKEQYPDLFIEPGDEPQSADPFKALKEHFLKSKIWVLGRDLSTPEKTKKEIEEMFKKLQEDLDKTIASEEKVKESRSFSPLTLLDGDLTYYFPENFVKRDKNIGLLII